MAQQLVAAVPLLEALVRQRLVGWPAKWEGYHWPGYTYEHTLRVRDLALSMAAAEGADTEVVLLASLLHDIAKMEGRSHAAAGAQEAFNILEAHSLNGSLRERVCAAIGAHSGDNTPYSPVENRCLGDADLIDANFGLVAVWRFITIRAGHGAELDDTVLSMREWLPKKDALLDSLLTRRGREIARQRAARMRVFCEQLAEQCVAQVGTATFQLMDVVQCFHGDQGRRLLAEQLCDLDLIIRDQATDPVVAVVCRSLRAEMAGLH